MKPALQNRLFNRIVITAGLLVVASLFIVRSYGYSEITIEYKGQPITFGRHYVCYNTIDFNIAFLVPYNFRVVGARSGRLTSTVLPDGKLLIARLPQTCGFKGSELSVSAGTSALPALMLADKPEEPMQLTVFVGAAELQRGVADLKLLDLRTRLTAYPTGLSKPDSWQASWYNKFGKYNTGREIYYYGGMCRNVHVPDVPHVNRNKPFFERERQQLAAFTEPDVMSYELASEVRSSLSLLKPVPDLIRYEISPATRTDPRLLQFSPDTMTDTATYIPTELRDGVLYPRPDLAGTIILYGKIYTYPSNREYTIDYHGKRLTTHYSATGYNEPATQSLLVCDRTSL